MNDDDRSPMDVEAFFHKDSGTFTYVIYAGEGGSAVVIDPVLDFDIVAASTSTQSADAVVAFVEAHRLQVEWVLETHAHADHLSAGDHLRNAFRCRMAIGRGILGIQAHFKDEFGLGSDFVADGSQFDRLLDDGEELQAESLRVRVIATPGHTADGLTYLIGDAAFVGDTLFAPDIGTARCDFPGGNAASLHKSIRRILALPAQTRIFLCHDYPPQQRGPIAECSVAAQRADNVHVGNDATEDAFVTLRQTRDAKLAPPRLMWPALQVNIRGGRLPPADANGVSYLKLPLNRLAPKPPT